jgi:hypothetical protein
MSVSGARVARGTSAAADRRSNSPIHRGIGRSLTRSTEKNHACEEKTREKGWPEVGAQICAEGRSQGDTQETLAS